MRKYRVDRPLKLLAVSGHVQRVYQVLQVILAILAVLSAQVCYLYEYSSLACQKRLHIHLAGLEVQLLTAPACREIPAKQCKMLPLPSCQSINQKLYVVRAVNHIHTYIKALLKR